MPAAVITIPSIQVAVVEDDAAIGNTVGEMLAAEGYSAIQCRTGGELIGLIARERIDLILLDLQLPDCNGLALASQIRSTAQTPIIMLTAKGSEIDRVVGLEVGADDYIVKPFNVREVAARVRAVLRRTRPLLSLKSSASTPRRGYRFAGWTLDLDLRRLLDPEGEWVTLTVAEFDLLSAIVGSRGRVLTRAQLLDMTRTANADVFDRTIDVLILRLRRKIEPNPHQPQLLVTERGLGYRFGADVERVGEAP